MRTMAAELSLTMISFEKTLIFLILIFLPATALAWSGQCVGVADGDTIKVMHNGKAEKIRLYGIDCPEKKQAYGKKAKQFTAEMVFKQTVDVSPITVDRYGRTIAWIYVAGKCLNKELLRVGLAWHYKRYSQDEDLAMLEIEARRNKVGLWSDSHVMAPWIFRR